MCLKIKKKIVNFIKRLVENKFKENLSLEKRKPNKGNNYFKNEHQIINY